MINREKINNFLIAHNGKNVFHPTYVGSKNYMSTGQPYIIVSTNLLGNNNDKEDDVVNKLFINPLRNENNEYDYNTLTPKKESDLIAISEII